MLPWKEVSCLQFGMTGTHSYRGIQRFVQLIQHLLRLAVRLIRHLRKQPRFQDLSLALEFASVPS